MLAIEHGDKFFALGLAGSDRAELSLDTHDIASRLVSCAFGVVDDEFGIRQVGTIFVRNFDLDRELFSPCDK